MRSIAILAALGTSPGCVGGGGCRTPTVSDRCTEPGAASLATLELGQGQGEAFQPLADSDTVPRVWGGQGSAMVVVHLRMTGQVPGCIEQTTTLYDGDGNRMDDEPFPMTTYPAGGGAHTTGQMFLVLDHDAADGDVLRLTAEAGGLMAERSLHLEVIGPDAMPDSGPGDGDGGPLDAGGADALPTDAGFLDAAGADAFPGDASPGAAVDGG